MARVVDITEKLSFEENPKLLIKGKEFEVDSSAETVLKIMGKLGNDEHAVPKTVVEMYELLFSEKDRKEIKKLKLNFRDFQKLVEAAIDLVVGGEEEPGEH